jgi:hypothetical protein
VGKLVITLEEQDLLDLQEILLDDDKEGALNFVKNRIASKIPGKGTGHCDSTRCNPYLMKPGGTE